MMIFFIAIHIFSASSSFAHDYLEIVAPELSSQPLPARVSSESVWKSYVLSLLVQNYINEVGTYPSFETLKQLNNEEVPSKIVTEESERKKLFGQLGRWQVEEVELSQVKVWGCFQNIPCRISENNSVQSVGRILNNDISLLKTRYSLTPMEEENVRNFVSKSELLRQRIDLGPDGLLPLPVFIKTGEPDYPYFAEDGNSRAVAYAMAGYTKIKAFSAPFKAVENFQSQSYDEKVNFNGRAEVSKFEYIIGETNIALNEGWVNCHLNPNCTGVLYISPEIEAVRSGVSSPTLYYLGAGHVMERRDIRDSSAGLYFTKPNTVPYQGEKELLMDRFPYEVTFNGRAEISDHEHVIGTDNIPLDEGWQKCQRNPNCSGLMYISPEIEAARSGVSSSTVYFLGPSHSIISRDIIDSKAAFYFTKKEH